MSEFEVLGPYRIGNVIGRGGMGSVYEAIHATTGERYAVKLIAQHVADDARFRRRFHAEVETLKRLRHPGIVQLVGYGEEAGRLFYSMELVQGDSLQQRLREVKRLGWLPAVEIAIQICAALKHAHDIGVIHRDLKPANLLLTDAGQVKLVDFGIAKLFGYGEQTAVGSVLGTADYMAPEQADGTEVTVRTDLYALGSVMYAMMAGRSPFAGKKLTQVIESLRRDRAVPLDLVNPDVPSEVVEIVHHLLEKDPKSRPPTALSVMNRLKATRAGLQRSKTIATDSSLTSSDIDRPGAISNDPTSETQLSQFTDADMMEGGDLPTGPTRHRSPTAHRVQISRGTGASGLSNVDAIATQGTELAEDTDATDFSTGAAHQTHFETIEPGVDQRGVFGSPGTGDRAESNWVHWLSVAGMLAVLGAGGYLIARAMQGPSADDLFAQLQTAEQADELTMQGNVIERFLQSYPNDPRSEQVAVWRDESELERQIRRLTSQARSSGGISRLPPMQQAFLQAMMTRASSTANARRQLQAWLDVYAVEAPADPGEKPLQKIAEKIGSKRASHLSRLVRFELARLEALPPEDDKQDERLLALQSKLALATSLEDAQRQRLLEGIIALHGEAKWAQPVVEQAREQLANH